MINLISFDKNKDKIAIIAPSSGVNDLSGSIDIEQSMNRLDKMVSLLKKHGFNCSYDNKIFDNNNSLGYFSSSKEERLRQLQDAIKDTDAKIIWAFRGGYGSLEIAFDCLNIVPSCPKILIGFSDITALHFLFNQHYKLPSIHGAMDANQEDMIREVISVIEGNEMTLDLTSLNDISDNANVSGKMIGGNLTMICNLIGTKLHPIFEDKILFLEDVNEKGYEIHRHLLHMHNAGLLKKVRAIIFGDFTNSDKHIDSSITDFANRYLTHIPSYKIKGVGHGAINHPIAIGGIGKISADRLTIVA